MKEAGVACTIHTGGSSVTFGDLSQHR
jgi:hypothetical protein